MIQNKIVRSAAAVVWFAGLIAGSQPASAYTQGACQADALKFCPGMTGRNLTPCLRLHQADLAQSCKENLAEAQKVVRDLYESCQKDIDYYCAEVPVGEGRIRKCLRSHEANLTADCKAEIAGARERYKSILPTPSTAAAPAAK